MSNNTNTLFWVITGAVTVLGIFTLVNNVKNDGVTNSANTLNSTFSNVVNTDPNMLKYYSHEKNYQYLFPTPAEEFEFNSSTGTITKYMGESSELVIPYEINGVPVKRIDTLKLLDYHQMSLQCERIKDMDPKYVSASYLQDMKDSKILVDGVCHDRPLITKVVFPNTIETIGIKAFLAQEIEELNLPNSLQFIDIQGFSDNKIKKLKLDHLTNLVSIGSSAFSYNEISGILTFPRNMTRVLSGAFEHNNLTGVILHDKFDYLGDSNFVGNPNLEYVIIKNPNNVRIGRYSNHFDDNNNAILYVPTGKKEYYRTFSALDNVEIIEKDFE